jgi:uncharacterized protein (TIGR02996 family)
VTELDALLAAARANPDEDTPRLVLADWYAENPEVDGAEFREAIIRNQVEFARTHEPESPEVRKTTARNIVALAEKVPSPPIHGWTIYVAGKDYGVFWERGLVAGVFCDLKTWVKFADELRAKHPIQKVWINSYGHLMGAVDLPDSGYNKDARKQILIRAGGFKTLVGVRRDAFNHPPVQSSGILYGDHEFATGVWLKACYPDVNFVRYSIGQGPEGRWVMLKSTAINVPCYVYKGKVQPLPWVPDEPLVSLPTGR